jgi:hypothetical protein
MNAVERELATAVTFFSGRESRTKQDLPGPRHFHLAIAAFKAIPIDLLGVTWNHLAGRDRDARRFNEQIGLWQSEHVVVEAYDSNKRDLQYIARWRWQETKFRPHKTEVRAKW